MAIIFKKQAKVDGVIYVARQKKFRSLAGDCTKCDIWKANAPYETQGQFPHCMLPEYEHVHKFCCEAWDKGYQIFFKVKKQQK